MLEFGAMAGYSYGRTTALLDVHSQRRGRECDVPAGSDRGSTRECNLHPLPCKSGTSVIEPLLPPLLPDDCSACRRFRMQALLGGQYNTQQATQALQRLEGKITTGSS